MQDAIRHANRKDRRRAAKLAKQGKPTGFEQEDGTHPELIAFPPSKRRASALRRAVRQVREDNIETNAGKPRHARAMTSPAKIRRALTLEERVEAIRQARAAA